ncbi:hypothetical protein HDV00_007015, partial [Rhizophlyctis rosea]
LPLANMTISESVGVVFGIARQAVEGTVVGPKAEALLGVTPTFGTVGVNDMGGGAVGFAEFAKCAVASGSGVHFNSG